MKFDSDNHVYTHKGQRLLSVTEILKGAGLVDHLADEYYLDRGTKIHKACQFFDEGTLDFKALDPIILPYVEAWMDFKAASRIKIIAIEKMVRHKELGYAGRLDRLGKMNGLKAVIDIKTGQIPEFAKFQLAAYAHAAGGPMWRIGVHLKADGSYSLMPFSWSDYESDLAQFLWALKEVSNGRAIGFSEGNAPSPEA